MTKLTPRTKIILLLGLLAAGLATSAIWAGNDLGSPRAMKERLAGLLVDLGHGAPLVYIALYWLSPVLFLPAIPLSLVGGALFGPFWGAVYGLIGSTGGSVTGFVIGRAMGHDFVAKRAHGKFLALKAGIEKEGWRFVAFVRLVPLLPFGIVNIALGVTEISLFSYTLTSLLAMAPGAFVYAYLGYVGRMAASGQEGLLKYAMIGVGLLVLLSGIPTAIRYARQRKAADDRLRGQDVP